jgi:seryl-tRNA synthetase
MDNLKFIFTLIIISVLVGVGGYWAVASMQSGSEYVNNQKIKKLETENEELKQALEKLNKELGSTQDKVAEKPAEVVAEVPKEEKPAEPTKPVATPKTYKNQTLINELQSLVNKGVVMEPGDRGPSVGTIQKFFNVYNKTSKKIDNDFGATTKANVIDFQKDEKLSPDGGIGKTTLSRMVTWLKNQG